MRSNPSAARLILIIILASLPMGSPAAQVPPGGKWVLEPGEFKAWVGSDSQALLEASFRVGG